jgi:hypothetical protein
MYVTITICTIWHLYGILYTVSRHMEIALIFHSETKTELV